MGIRHCGAVRCAPEAAEQRTPNGEGTEKMSERNRRLRAAGIAALAPGIIGMTEGIVST